MRFLGDTHDEPRGAVGRAADQPDSNFSNIRSPRDSDCATNDHVTRCQHDRFGRRNGDRELGPARLNLR